jgi:hypothetical protein
LYHGASELALGDGAVAALFPVVPLAEEVGEARRVLHERITQLLARLRGEGGEGLGVVRRGRWELRVGRGKGYRGNVGV